LRLLASVTAIRAHAEAQGPGFDPDSIQIEPLELAPASRQVWGFLGAPGSGVTRLVCALASRLHGRDRCSVGLLSAGDETHARGLRGFADAMGLPLHATGRSCEIADAAASLGHRSLVLVDFPGAGPRDGDRLGAHARSLQALVPHRVCAVLAADADELALRRQIEVFGRLGATHVALSRVDLAARLEPALQAIAAASLPLAWISHGAGGAAEVSPASRSWLARACDRTMAMA
jgi:flagellar biosynthesis protein FlhF